MEHSLSTARSLSRNEYTTANSNDPHSIWPRKIPYTILTSYLFFLSLEELNTSHAHMTDASFLQGLTTRLQMNSYSQPPIRRDSRH